jgi:hypothetical protein
MVPPACSHTHSRLCLRLSLCLLFSFSFAFTAYTQTATYHLHRDSNVFQLKSAGPDTAAVAVQSANLKNQALGEYLIKGFDTQSGVPNAAGVIPAGSTVAFTVWMKKTANQATMLPRVKLNLNSAAGTSVCVVTGTTALSTTLTKYILTGTVSSNVSVTTTDRFFLWVGVNLTASSNQNNQAELDIEGTLNGNYDSLITVPLPVAPPSISSLSPNIGGVGTPVTVAGTNFGTTQVTSTIKFNGITATPTSWSATSIVVPVPTGATTGSVVVAVTGQTSNSVAFSVTSRIDSLTPNSGPVGTAVAISGTTFGATQGTSTLTFNGSPATPSSWSATSILAAVPAGSTTGPVVVTTAGQPSNGVTFTVTDTGAIGGVITRSSDGAPINGAFVEAVQGGVVKASTTTAANGSYSVSNVEVGTYDVRASAAGYQTRMHNGVVVNTNTTTAVNESLDAATPSDINYVYDELGRLVAVISSAETVVHRYDAVGNLLSISRGNSSQVSIIEFTPNGGSTGAEVTIYGTAFSATASQNAVTFNGVAANVSSATTTQIVTDVPPGATTGPITVTAPAGAATSGTSFIVGESGAPTITVFSPTIGAAGTSVTITGTNFESNLFNNRVDFNLSLSSITSATNTTITTKVPLGAVSGRIGVGTPAGTAVSSADFFVAPSPHPAADIEVTGRMAIGEDRIVTITQPNKIAIIVFDGVAGQRMTLGMSGVTIGAPSCCDVASVVVYKPGGTFLVSPLGFGTAGNGTATQVLPVSGTYSIVVDPYDVYTGSVTLSLFQDVAVPISINGPAVPLNITRVGQNARLTFSGTAGQRVSVGISGVSIGAPNYYDVGSIAIYKPDGTALVSPLGFGTAGNGTPTQVLPVTGTYSIIVDPYSANIGSGTVSLSEDLANPITINGPPLTLSFRPGQNTWLPFEGTAGQRVSVGISAVSIGAPNYYDVGSIAIYKPDGTPLASPLGFGTAGNGTATQVLPVTGTYTVVVDPYYANVGNGTLSLSEDLANPIEINGPPLTLTFRAGQNARLPFDGTAGQQVSVGIGGVTIGAPNYYDVGSIAIYKPDGTLLASALGFGTAGNGTATQVLPVTGIYTVVVDPYNANAGNGTVSLSDDLANPIEINGPPLTLSFRPGQNARLPFDGAAGQRVSVGISGVTIGAPNYYNYNLGTIAIYKPDGTALASPLAFANEGNGTATQVLPVTGTYTVVVDPYGANAGNGTISLSEDLANPITINGPPLTLSFRAGQNTWLPFDGTAGQRVSVGISGVTIGAPNYYNYNLGTIAIYKPDGTPLASPLAFANEGNGTATQVLPVTGTYKVVVDPYVAYAGNGTVSLSEDLANPIEINGPPLTLTFRAGQNTWLPFDGTAGQRVSVGISGVTIGAPNYYNYNLGTIAIYKPDGTALASPLAFANGGHGTATQVLPVTGTYKVVVDPYVAYAGNGTVSLSEDLANPITINGPPLTLSFRAGQNTWLPFNGTAGQRVSVGISGVTIGAPNYYNYELGTIAIYKPDGTPLASPLAFANGGNGTATQVLPVSGTYSVVVDPTYANAGNGTVTLSEDLANPITINGAPLTLTFRPGQNAFISFNGNASQQVTIRVTGNTLGDVAVKLLKSDGTQLIAITSSSSSFNLATQILPVTGTYMISIDPLGSNSGGLSLAVEDQSGNLALNKTATQSSLNWSAPADRGVDGNTDGNFWNGSVTHTQVENQAWWHVDLGSLQTIGRIDVWNRTDCCGEALSNFYVFVSDQPFASTDVTATQNQAGVWTYYNPSQAAALTSITVNRTGRYIRVQLAGVERLSLAEVQVWP